MTMRARLVTIGGGLYAETSSPNVDPIPLDIGYEEPEARQLLSQAWDRLDQAQLESLRVKRGPSKPLTIALRKCRGQAEIDAVLRVHAEDAMLPNARHYHIAYDDENVVSTTRHDALEMIKDGLCKVIGRVDDHVLIEPCHDALSVVAAGA